MIELGRVCLHIGERSEPDAGGKALCLRCGEVFQAVLTRELLLDTADSIRRNLGSFGSHSKRCVELEDGGYLCADDCRMRR